MALAKPFNRAVKKMVEVTEQVPHVELNLSLEEAETLRAVCQRIGGNALTTRRGHMEAISRALFDAGVLVPAFQTTADNRAIYFTE